MYLDSVLVGIGNTWYAWNLWMFSLDNGRRETLVLYAWAATCIILPSRNKSFPREPFEFLHIRECLVSRSSRLDPRTFRASRLEVRVSSVNFLLSSTVELGEAQFRECSARPIWNYGQQYFPWIVWHKVLVPINNISNIDMINWLEVEVSKS